MAAVEVMAKKCQIHDSVKALITFPGVTVLLIW
jgi:hypothetical protein